MEFIPPLGYNGSMKVALIASPILIASALAFQELTPDLTAILIRMALEIPFVGALVYLVLKLEDKRQASSLLREKSNQQIIDSLLGLIDDLASRQNPDKITSRQYKKYDEYLKGELDDQPRRIRE